MKKKVTFSDINAAIAQWVDDPSIGDAGDFHLYKVLQHAIANSVSGFNQKKIPYKLHLPVWLQRLRYRLKSTLSKPVAQIELAPIVVIDDARRKKMEDGKTGSFFFSGTFQWLEERGYSYSILPRAKSKDDIGFIASYNELREYCNTPLSRAEIGVLIAIREVAVDCANFDLPDFRDHLYSALQIFFEDFHCYYQLFKGQGIRTLLMTTHYHSEGMILAARMHKIEVIEYQHGLIAPKDVYYCYPKIVERIADKALFADRILVFGDYWKRVLLEGHEYPEHKISVVGDYGATGEPSGETSNEIEKENAIFVGTQKTMADAYVDYLKPLAELLLEKHPDWKLIVKLHPFEPEPEKYDALLVYRNCEVIGTEASLVKLFQRSRIQITIYSTTLFDALGYGVHNFAIQHYTQSSDYAEDMVKLGVAEGLLTDEDPVERYLNSASRTEQMRRSDVYASFSPEVLNSILKVE
jgi:hypothetical protein